MHTTISAKEMRLTLPDVVRRVRRGARYTVLFRSRPAFDLVPVGGADTTPGVAETLTVLRARLGIDAAEAWWQMGFGVHPERP